MKTALTAFLLVVVVLTVPAAASADNWVMDWNSTGNVVTAPFGWSITGSSPTTLTPMSGGLPPFFTGQAYNLGFTWEGRGYGGAVATGTQFQTSSWSVPAPCNSALNCRFNTNFASGTFNFTDANHFALDVFLGAGHNNAHLVGLGTLSGGGGSGGGVATAAEPTVLLLSGAGLVGAAVLRRARRS
jgi:opacity protein-like surface antigen